MKKFRKFSEAISPQQRQPEQGREAVGGRFVSSSPKGVSKPAPQVTSEDVEQIEEGRPSQRHPLEGHEYHKKTDAELVHIAKDAHKAAEAMKGHNTDAENKYRDQANDSATVRYFRQKSGMPNWYKKKYGHVKEEVVVEGSYKTYQPKHVAWVVRHGDGKVSEFKPHEDAEAKAKYDQVKDNRGASIYAIDQHNQSIPMGSLKALRRKQVVAEGWRATGGRDNAGGQSYDIDNGDGTIGMGYKPGKHYSSSSSTVEIKSEPKHPLHGKQVTNGKVTGRLMGTEHQGTVAKIKHSSGMIHHVDAKEIRKIKEEVEQIDEDTPPIHVRSLYTQTYAKHGKTAAQSKTAQELAYRAVEKKHGSEMRKQLADYHAKNQNEEVEKKYTPPFLGPYKKAKDEVKDKSGAKHSKLSRVKHLAKLGMKKVNEEGMGDPGLIDTNAKLTLAKKKTNIVKTAAKNAKEKNSGKFNPDPILSSPVAKQNDSV